MQMVRYFDEYGWVEEPGGLTITFSNKKGEKLAEASLVDFERKLWKYEVILPEQFQVEGRNPAGIVYSAAAAKRVAETILLNTILVR